MKFIKKSLFLFIAILMLAVTSITACGFLGFGSTEKWKEEVQLSDGQIIIVYREIINEMGGDEWASNRSGLKPKEYRIWFVNPDGSGKKVEWKAKISSDTYPEIPLILDIISKQPVIYTLMGISPGCEVYKKYVYRNGGWSEETLPEKFEPRKRNLLVKGRDIPGYVNLEMKHKIDESGLDRRAVMQAGPNRKYCD